METGEDNYKIVYRDEEVSAEMWAHAHLSVQIETKTFSWCITDSITDLVFEVGKLTRKPREELLPFVFIGLSEITVRQTQYQSVSFSHKGVPTVLVPTGLYHEDQVPALHEFHFGKTENKLQSTALKTGEIVLVQELNPEIEKAIQQRFPNAQHISNAAVIIDAMVKKTRFEETPHILVDVESSFSELYVIQKGQLLLLTQFETATSEDILFHIANACDQLKLDLSKSHLLLTGCVEIGDHTYKLLKNYAPNLRMHFGFTFSKMAKELSTVKKQEFMSLLNQYACVS
jgi:hypothetical protein